MRRFGQTWTSTSRGAVGALALAALAGALMAGSPAANAAPAAVRTPSSVSVTTVVTFPLVPKGYPARVRGSVSRTAGTTVTLQLQQQQGTAWTTVSEQALAADAPSSYAFELPTATTSKHAYRVAATSSDTSTAATPGFVVTVVAAAIRRVQPTGDEFVVLKNTGTTKIDLRRWHLGTKAGALLMPKRIIKPGATLRIYTGSGDTTSSRLYLGLTNNLWHKSGTALLTTRDELKVASLKF